MINLFKKKIKKYEFMTLRCAGHNASRDSKRLQDQGWEVAGESSTFNGNFDYTGIIIPFRRIINER